MKVYISPSTQERNLYHGGGNEEQYMRLVSLRAAEIVRAHGHEVRVGGIRSAYVNTQDANRWGAALYIAVHSNAFDGSADGTIVFYYPTSAPSRQLAQALHDRVAPVSPGSDYGTRANSQLVELNATRMPAALVEVAFHDNAIEAAHIRANHALYAQSVADGILDVAGRSAPEPHPAPAPAPKPAGKSVAQLADEVIAGLHGSGNARKRALGIRYSEVQAEVNRRLLGRSTPASQPKAPVRKTVAQLATEVIDGKWGNGNTRKARLALAGHNYRAVQDEVNRRLR